MKIPPRSKYIRPLTVHGQVWTVKVVKRMPKGFSNCLGVRLEDKQTIYINAKQSEAQMFGTFFHEYLHIFLPYLPEEMTEQVEQAFMSLWVSF